MSKSKEKPKASTKPAVKKSNDPNDLQIAAVKLLRKFASEIMRGKINLVALEHNIETTSIAVDVGGNIGILTPTKTGYESLKIDYERKKSL